MKCKLENITRGSLIHLILFIKRKLFMPSFPLFTVFFTSFSEKQLIMVFLCIILLFLVKII